MGVFMHAFTETVATAKILYGDIFKRRDELTVEELINENRIVSAMVDEEFHKALAKIRNKKGM
jgi:hypothetical protein